MREKGRRASVTGVAGLLVALAMSGALTATQAQAPAAAETAIYRGSPHRYTVALPVVCRHEEGPGTVDAICAPDLDPAKSVAAKAASALLLSVAAEAPAGNGDTSVAGLLQRYTEAGFKEEVPEAVCGESDRARVKIENLSQAVEDSRLVYTADVTCAEVKFLRIAKRRAAVRYVIGPDAVFRLVARAQEEDFDKRRSTIDAFLASFQITAAEQAEK